MKVEETMTLYGGIEAGGTKFVCVVGSGPEDIRAEVRFPTTTPNETLALAVQFFKEQSRFAPIAEVGVAAFGPLDLDPQSPTYGYITATPKPGWSHTPLVEKLRSELSLPIVLDTDVNGAALGEYRWGAGQNTESFLYITIGTGIGGGAIVRGNPLHGLVHPEMGHFRIPHDLSRDPFPGSCPFHGDCFEGLASGPALKSRWGQPAETLPDDHPGWELEAEYISLALSAMVCILSPQRIVLGGGVMQNHSLFPAVRRKLGEVLNGYIQSPRLLQGMDSYITPPGLGVRSGMLGALALAEQSAILE